MFVSKILPAIGVVVASMSVVYVISVGVLEVDIHPLPKKAKSISIKEGANSTSFDANDNIFN